MDLLQPISTIMTRNIKVVPSNASLTQISEIFDNVDFHHIPVVDKEGNVDGMISKDVYFQLMDKMTFFNTASSKKENQKFFNSILARDIMGLRPTCIHETASIKSAINIFITTHLRALPVVSEGMITGIVTPTDIMNGLLEEISD